MTDDMMNKSTDTQVNTPAGTQASTVPSEIGHGNPMRLWSLAAVLIIVAFVYLTRGILLPFLIGLAIAYLLDPVADRLEGCKVPRGMAAALVIAVFFLSGFGILIALFPVLQQQVTDIAGALPATLAQLRPWLETFIAENGAAFSQLLGDDLDSILASAMQSGLANVQTVLTRLVSEGLAIFNIFALLLISPVVAFYLLRDWDLMIARLDHWLPKSVAPTVRIQLGKIDAVLSNFVRGQMIICLVMGGLYAVGWSLVGLNYSLALGVFAGVLAFVPFVGVVFALLVALLTAVGQWGFDPANIGLVVGVFVAVQTFEGMLLTPKLMGDRIGLHPVWVLFAAFAGGEILGFTGVLLALPIAAAIAVLVRFAIERYEDYFHLNAVDTDLAGEKEPQNSPALDGKEAD